MTADFVEGMITERVVEPVLENLRPLGDLNEAKSRISWSKQRVHDRFNPAELQTHTGWVSEPEVYGLASRASSFFVGETPEGRRIVFGIVPQIESKRFGDVPASLLSRVDYANKVGLLKAINAAQQTGQISEGDARYQASLVAGIPVSKGAVWSGEGVDPAGALDIVMKNKGLNERPVRPYKPSQDQDETGGNVLRVAGGLAGALAVPSLSASVASKDFKGSKRTRIFAGVFLGTGVTQVLLSACSPITQIPETVKPPSAVATQEQDVPVCDPEAVLGSDPNVGEISICGDLGKITEVSQYEAGSNPDLEVAVANKIQATLGLTEAPESLIAFNIKGEGDSGTVYMYKHGDKYYMVMSWFDENSMKFIDSDNWKPEDLLLFELNYKGDGVLASPNGIVFIEAQADGSIYWRFLTEEGQDVRFPVESGKGVFSLIPDILRPDFESMTDEELLQSMEKWGEFFANQIDCSPGAIGLPAATRTPERVKMDQYTADWRTEYLGYYKVRLSDERNIPVGYVICHYFAASEPGGVLAVWGGGELWGQRMVGVSASGMGVRHTRAGGADPEGLLSALQIGAEYNLTLASHPNFWESLDTETKILIIRQNMLASGLTYVDAVGRMVDMSKRFEQRLSPQGYPGIIRQKLINNPTIPVSPQISLPE